MPQCNGKEVGPIGYGLMGLTWRANPCPEEQAFAAMRESLTRGCNFWNAGEFYGSPEYNSTVLLERYFAKYPEDADRVVISFKAGVDVKTLHPDGSPASVRRSIDAYNAVIKGRKKIDTFECARRDAKVPLTETFGALDECIKKGDIGGISLSEVSAATIHEAVKIAKIDSVEVELSLWNPDVLHNGIAAACAQYNIPIVAYSPIGRGFLTGEIKSFDDIPEGDFRRNLPRFQPENFEQNIKLVDAVKVMASKKGCTPAQLAINWVRCLSQRNGLPVIIPIPGATTVERVKENSTIIDLSDEEMAEIQNTMSKYEIKGDRYAEGHPTNT
ncbi:pyridoxal reductase [Pyricularia oryzae 70-15]|uniref:Pyridoxal reductase n=2 Tax=Pyricularia oryzae TaxID=318829 RepID=G4NCL8_PYRO7|nr:pyridoxal reductase [Pyricularia oryzae 70-15]EHA49112.1 pyridoxal reductase [Pyricularia oryzae 70-15]KAI7915041.1 pyridoxal reductase [Pyricularia oryzae]